MKTFVAILLVLVVILSFSVVALWIKVEGLENSKSLVDEALNNTGEYMTLNNQRLANDEQSISDLIASDSKMLDLIESILAYQQDELELHRGDGQQESAFQVPADWLSRFVTTRRLTSIHCIHIQKFFAAGECQGGELYYRISGGEWFKIPGRPWETWTMHLPDDAVYCFVDELAGAVLGETAADQVCSIF